jgi:hypothetical protein
MVAYLRARHIKIPSLQDTSFEANMSIAGSSKAEHTHLHWFEHLTTAQSNRGLAYRACKRSTS